MDRSQLRRWASSLSHKTISLSHLGPNISSDSATGRLTKIGGRSIAAIAAGLVGAFILIVLASPALASSGNTVAVNVNAATGTLTIANETTPAGGTGFTFTVDPGNYNFDFKWNGNGHHGGEFLFPHGMAMDAAGNVYVVDTGKNRVQKFNSNGDFVTKWGQKGSGNGQFNTPRGIAVDAAGNVYVVDTYNYRIQKFDSNGNYLAKWGRKGSGNGQFYYPTRMTVDSHDNAYVVDSGLRRIQKFDSNGGYLTQWGNEGNGSGQFQNPLGITVDAADNVYVADTGNHRIQIFDSNGGFRAKWGANGGDGSFGSGNGQFSYPNSVALDAAGNVYVADTSNNRIQKFDSSGDYLDQWGSKGTGNGQFNDAIDLAVNAVGNVYVLDASRPDIQAFTSDLTTTLNSEQSSSFDLAPGDYLIGELVPNSWALDNISCDAGSPTYGDSTASVSLAAGNDVTCTFSNSQPAGYCPVGNAAVGTLRTDLIGTGQGSTTKGFRTRKMIIPNYQNVSSLYGQLAAVDTGVMKFVRFRYPNGTTERIDAPTSPAYTPSAISWWGSDVTPSKFIKGEFFWGKGGNKSPRAFVLWPTYDTDDQYANVFVTFDDSSTNHVAWQPNFLPTQTQVIDIPETQADGATVVIHLAIVDNDKDNRPVLLDVTVGSETQSNADTKPNSMDTLNLYELTFNDVPAGVNQVTITLTSPAPSQLYPGGGDSAAIIGAAVNYACAIDTP